MKKREIIWILIPMLLVCNTLVYLMFEEDYQGIGTGTTTDSRFYIEIADSLPYLKEALFPVLYPIVISIVNFLIDDYYVSTKVIGFMVIVFCYAFTYYKNFFWKEFWGLLAFPVMTRIYIFSLAEIILLPLLILLVYLNHNYFKEKITYKKYIFWNAIILALLCITKYSAFFIIFGCFFYSAVLFFYNRKKFTPFFVSVLSASVLVGIYLMINNICTGTLVGQRTGPIKDEMNIRYSFFNILYVINPVVAKRIILGYKINYLLLSVFDFFILLIYFIMIRKGLKKGKVIWETTFCITLGFIFLVLTIISYFQTHIDDLNPRLLFPYVFLFLTAVIFSSKLRKTGYNILLIIIIFSLILSLLNGIYEFSKTSIIFETEFSRLKGML